MQQQFQTRAKARAKANLATKVRGPERNPSRRGRAPRAPRLHDLIRHDGHSRAAEVVPSSASSLSTVTCSSLTKINCYRVKGVPAGRRSFVAPAGKLCRAASRARHPQFAAGSRRARCPLASSHVCTRCHRKHRDVKRRHNRRTQPWDLKCTAANLARALPRVGIGGSGGIGGTDSGCSGGGGGGLNIDDRARSIL